MGKEDKRWSWNMEDSDGNVHEVKFHNYETEDGSTTSVEMGPNWKNTYHGNENNDRAPSYHKSVYDNNNDYHYNDDEKTYEEKTWYNDDGSVSKSETYDSDGNVYDNTSEYTDDDDSEDNGSNGGDSGCFLTSACIQYRSLPDDCKELTVLRNFRDTYMSSTENGRMLIKEYYRIAPEIVSNIDASTKRNYYYKKIYEVIIKCVEYIESKKNILAENLYCEMTRSLKAEFRIM